MRQHPDDYEHEDLDHYDDQDGQALEELGTPVYQGTGLSVRALTAEELQRFLDAHADQPARLLGSGWATLDPPEHPLEVPRTPPAAAVPAEVTGTLGSPGRSALAAYRRRRAEELAAWTRTLTWRVPLVPANVDHLVIGPTGVFIIDSKQWTGSVHQGADGLTWHNHYRLDRTLESVRWEAETVGRLLGTRTAALLCVHGAHVQGGGLDAQGVAIVPAHLLCGALGCDRVLSDADVKLLATTAWASLRPAA